jgi:hypothetical protein
VPANLYLEGSLFELGLGSLEGRACLSQLSSIPKSLLKMSTQSKLRGLESYLMHKSTAPTTANANPAASI